MKPEYSEYLKQFFRKFFTHASLRYWEHFVERSYWLRVLVSYTWCVPATWYISEVIPVSCYSEAPQVLRSSYWNTGCTYFEKAFCLRKPSKEGSRAPSQYFFLFCLKWSFFSLFPFWYLMCSASISIFDVELFFSSSLILLGSIRSSRFLWQLVQKCRCASVIMCIILCLLYFFPRNSSTPELLGPVLRPRTASYCGDELMWDQQHVFERYPHNRAIRRSSRDASFMLSIPYIKLR